MNKSINKCENGRYSEQFKNDIRKCIERGLTSNQTAEELGIEPLGSGYRQLYYKLAREYNKGKLLPTMRVGGLASGTKLKSDAGIKKDGVVINDKETKTASSVKSKVNATDFKTSNKKSSEKVVTLEDLFDNFINSVNVDDVSSLVSELDNKITSLESLTKLKEREYLEVKQITAFFKRMRERLVGHE